MFSVASTSSAPVAVDHSRSSILNSLQTLEAAIANGRQEEAASIAVALSKEKIVCRITIDSNSDNPDAGNEAAVFSQDMMLPDFNTASIAKKVQIIKPNNFTSQTPNNEAYQAAFNVTNFTPINGNQIILKSAVEIPNLVPPLMNYPIASTTVWVCPKCTVHNTQEVRVCAVCNARRPPKRQRKTTVNEDKPVRKRRQLLEQFSHLSGTEKQLPTNPATIVSQPVIESQYDKLPTTMIQLDDKKISDENVTNYEVLLRMEEIDLIENSQNFECSICFTDCPAKKGVILKTCLHMFCRECLARLIQLCEEVEVRCPFRDDDYACEDVLLEREIKALVSPEIFNRFLARSVNVAESKTQNAYHCKSINCTGWCIVDENSEINQFHCPVCQQTNCLPCQAIHPGLNCKQHQDIVAQKSATDPNAKKTSLKLEQMLKSGKAMSCPGCRVLIQKFSGCDAVSCSMCKMQLCWATKGSRWGPKGIGDTSGGCRCGLNGKLCHPKCKNCH